MIKLLLEPVNFLILDEPTNHLDMRTKDVLKEAIHAFDGTVILVSHDREFLDGLVDKVYEFGGGLVREHLGGIYDFLRKKDIESLDELHLNTAANTADDGPEKAPTTGRLSYEQQKERAKILRKAQKKVEECENRVTELEQQKKEIEARLSTPEGGNDSDLFSKYAEVQRLLSAAEEEWMTAEEECNALTAE